MAIQKEIWLPSVVQNLNRKVDWLKGVVTDDTPFLSGGGDSVHIPNSANLSFSIGTSITIDNTPATTTDQDISYDLKAIYSDVYYLTKFEAQSLSFKKEQAIVTDIANGLGHTALKSIVHDFGYAFNGLTSGTDYVETTGSSVAAHATTATGNRNAVAKEDIESAARVLDEQHVPGSDRYILLDSRMWWQLFNDLTVSDYRPAVINMNPTGDIKAMMYAGFTIIQVPIVGYATTGGSTYRAIGATGATTDVALGIAFQKEAVSMALGSANLTSVESARAYGYELSGDVWAGGSYRRYGYDGTCLIVQDTP